MFEQHLPGLCFNANELKNNHLCSACLDSTMLKFNCSEAMKQISNQDLFINNEATFKKMDGDSYLPSELRALPVRLACT